MNQKTITNQNLKRKESSRLKQRRAVADIISTMLLMGVTVTGASTLTYFMNDAFVTGTLGTATTLDASSLNVLLLAYDTRDASSLMSLDTIDNENIVNKFLCGVTCSVPPNLIPRDPGGNGGTEFIVFQIQNNDLNPFYLQDVIINDVIHSWDPLTGADVTLDASASNPLSGKYPSDGTFSIIPSGTLLQKSSTQIQNGEIVNILVKLGPDDSDIDLKRGILVKLNVGKMHLIEFVLESGDAR
jgi:hypothetical protein